MNRCLKNSAYHTPLYDAIRCKYLTKVETLVKLGADLTRVDETGRTPLHWGTSINSFPNRMQRMCEILINGGAEINAVDRNGNTPLLEALERGNTPAVRALIQTGADVNVRNNDNKGALSIERSYHWFKRDIRLELLLNAGVDVTVDGPCTLYEAVRNDEVKCVHLLIKAGTGVKSSSFDCLEAACLNGSETCLRLLLDAGADVNQISQKGLTVLFAASDSDVWCISRLIQAGAPVNHYDRSNLNALQNFVKKHGSNKEDLGLLLYASGEVFRGPKKRRLRRGRRNTSNMEVPKYLKQEEDPETTQNLDQICRKVIRKQFLDLNQHRNLFHRIPELPLPTCIILFLLFGYSVEGVPKNVM